MNWYKLSNKKPYLQKIKETNGFSVWAVDGDYIRDNVDLQFNNYGEHNKFDFIPKDEFWIDKESAKSEEVPFFINHMLIMSKEMGDGKTYDEAAEIAGENEEKEREKTKSHKQEIHLKLIKDLGNLKIWIVNGKTVRDIHLIDFTEGGHDRVYDFIPKNEVWIDNEIEAKEIPAILIHELHERHLMGKGMTYDDAHNRASALETKCRNDIDKLQKALKTELDRSSLS
jgi:hypothetical protein